MENREVLLKEDDQALSTHNRKRRRNQPIFKKGSHKEYQPPRRFQRSKESLSSKDYSGFQCFHCDKIGHIASNCPIKKQEYQQRINNNNRYHAHLAEDEDGEEEDEGPSRKQAREEDAEKYVLFSTLSGSVTPGEDTWLIDSGASKNMMGQKKTLSSLEENNLLRKYL